MGDNIKQTNFRIDQESADAFRKFCDENNLNQAQGFDHMIQVMELNRAKAIVPGSAKDIETFEMYMKKIMESYLKSVEDYSNARETAREDFASALGSKDKTIASLQEKADKLTEGKQILENVTATARAERDQAVKDAAAAKEQAETVAKLADEKDKTIATLADKLSIAESKADGYDDLKKSEEAAKLRISELEKEMERIKEAADREQKDHETEIRELKVEMERKISDAQKDAALELSKAVNEKEHEMMGQIREMDKLNARLQFENEELKKKINS